MRERPRRPMGEGVDDGVHILKPSQHGAKHLTRRNAAGCIICGCLRDAELPWTFRLVQDSIAFLEE
jgi:hypothetical protein